MERSSQPATSSFDLYNPSEEHEMLRRMVREFARKEVDPQAAEHDRSETFNRALFGRLGELGLLGVTVAAEHGGAGMDAVAAVIAHEELSTADPGFTLAYLAHSVLFVNNFYRNSNEAQRERVLDKVLSGEWVGGMCMSEPHCGTDVLGMQTRAVRQGEEYVLTGRKMWVTNGMLDDHTLGDVFLVYAKTGDAVSSFLVEKGRPGFEKGQKIKDKLGVRASGTAELVFEGCRIPVSNRLGEEGDSQLHMMRNLEVERLTLAAMSLGIGLRCLQVMTRYANERQSFGRPIRDFGQIQRHIARSYASWKAARAYVYDTARRLDLDREQARYGADTQGGIGISR